MASVTSASPRASSVFVVPPHNSYPVIQEVMSQVPVYPNNRPPVHLIPGNPPGVVSSVNVPSVQKVLKEGKVLEAVQILIGLVNLSLSSIMATMLSRPFMPVSFYGGFPFWGDIWFIISGSFSVAAENQPNHSCLLNGSVGFNIVSAISSAVGIILLITDIHLVETYTNSGYYPPHYILGVGPQP